MPTCGRPLILPPAPKRWGTPRRQGLCSHLAHLRATCDSAPRSEGSCDREPLSLAEEAKRELARGNASSHSMRLYRPPFTCGQCNRAVYLWCIYCDGCIHCLVGVECLARRFKARDEVKWVLRKWEKEVQVESILHPTASMNVDGSSTSVAEASSTPLDPVPPSSIPSGIVVAAPSSDHPTSPTGCPSAEQILADVCKALSDSQGSFRPSVSEVEALLGNDWRQPLHVTVPGLSPQQFEFEAREAILGTSPPRPMS